MFQLRSTFFSWGQHFSVFSLKMCHNISVLRSNKKKKKKKSRRCTFGELVEGQIEITESEDALSESSQFHVGGVEGVLQLVIQRLLLSVDEDGRALLQDALGSALHGHVVATVVLVLVVVDRHLVLVGRVERDLTHLIPIINNHYSIFIHFFFSIDYQLYIIMSSIQFDYYYF